MDFVFIPNQRISTHALYHSENWINRLKTSLSAIKSPEHLRGNWIQFEIFWVCLMSLHLFRGFACILAWNRSGCHFVNWKIHWRHAQSRGAFLTDFVRYKRKENHKTDIKLLNFDAFSIISTTKCRIPIFYPKSIPHIMLECLAKHKLNSIQLLKKYSKDEMKRMLLFEISLNLTEKLKIKMST